MSVLRTTVKVIDSISIGVGKTAAWIAVPMVLCLTFEVFVRYLFNSPTQWSYDVTYMIYGSHYLLGAAFAFYYKVHIRIDVFYNLFPPRARAFIDVLSFLVIFFPVMIVLTISGYRLAYDSYRIHEVSQFSPWMPILWPYKTIIAVSFGLLLLQGVAEFIRSLFELFKGEEI